MDTRTSSGDRAAARTGSESAWVSELYAACEMLRLDADGVITAVSVNVPRTEEPDNSVQVELLSIGVAKMYDLDVGVKPQGGMISVRFALPAPGHSSGAD